MALLLISSCIPSSCSNTNNNACVFLSQTTRIRRRGTVVYATNAFNPSASNNFPTSSPLPPALPSLDSRSSSSPASVEKLESLLFDSIFEIVRNIRDAPFVRYVFEGSGTRPSEVLRRASENSWPLIRDVLKESSPDCVILVQKLDTSSACSGLLLNDSCTSVSGEVGGGEELWGVLIEGKEVGVNACYILKTTQVPSPGGGRCTHFCITRVNCFGDSSACFQFSNSWLQQSQ